MALSLMYANNVHQIIRRRQQCGGFTDLRPSIEQQRSAIIVIIKIGLDLFAASLTPLSSLLSLLRQFIFAQSEPLRD